MKSVASEERRIQQQIVAQQKKELTTFLENQKKEYRHCKDKIKEVNGTNKHSTKFRNSHVTSLKYVTHIFRDSLLSSDHANPIHLVLFFFVVYVFLYVLRR